MTARKKTLGGVDIEASYGEPQVGFALFCAYLEMSPRRSIRGLADVSEGVVGKPVSFQQIGKYSKKWDWQRRCEQFDKAARVVTLERVLHERSDALLELWDKEIAFLRESQTKLETALNACSPDDYKRLRWILTSYRHHRAVVSEITAEQLQLWGVKIDEEQ